MFILVFGGFDVDCSLLPPALCGGEGEWEEARRKERGRQEEGVARGGGGGAVWEVHQADGGGEAH